MALDYRRGLTLAGTMTKHLTVFGTALVVISLSAATALIGQEQIVRVDLAYHAPGTGPAPNFSPYGTQVPLTTIAAGGALPPDATLPAKTGTVKIGPNQQSWLPVLATSDAAHPKDICRLYVDQNRNG